MGKTNKKPKPSGVKAKKTGGGTATAGGVDFQVAVLAIVSVHILRGKPIRWLDGIVADPPVAVWAESEASGDDIRVEFKDAFHLEIQVKKGLKRGPELWTPLEAMAKAIDGDQLPFGVLVVGPDASNTIREDLAKDVVRLGQGRSDHLSNIGIELNTRLSKLDLSIKKSCSSLRISVVHGLEIEDFDIRAAKDALQEICQRRDQENGAWNALYRHGVQLMRQRGRWSLRDLVFLLKNENIHLNDGHSPASLLNRLTSWTIEINSHFQITGMQRQIPIKSLIPMRITSISLESHEAYNASTALANYHQGSDSRLIGSDIFDAEWTGRFTKLVVVVAGPGLGKSTMMKILAYHYAKDGHPVLKVPLKLIAPAVKSGKAFSDALLSHGLSGSGISTKQVADVWLSNLVVLADGLDECGAQHDSIAYELRRFSIGHPDVRIVVTTRPIGYHTAELASWPHYRLLAPEEILGLANLCKLVAAAADKEPLKSDSENVVKRALGNTPAAHAIKVSPQLLGMAASLIIRTGVLPQTRNGLYENLIELFEDIPGNSAVVPSKAIAERVLDTIGWILLEDPLIQVKKVVERCSAILARDLHQQPLAATTLVESTLSHFERVGLVERVHHEGLPLLTFIHKSFAEFVGARYLVKLSPPERAKELNRIIDLPSWRELISFGADLGLGEMVVRLYIERRGAGYHGQLIHALDLVGSLETPALPNLVQELVDLAFEVIEQRETDFNLGVALARFAEKMPEIVGPPSTKRLNSNNPHIKLIAWGIAVKCGPAYFDVDVLTQILEELVPHVGAGTTRDPDGYLRINRREDRTLIGYIAVTALRAQPDAELKYFLENNLSDRKLHSRGLLSAMGEILQSRGEPGYQPSWMDQYTSLFKVTFPSSTWLAASRCMLFALTKAVAPAPGSAVAAGPVRHLLQFAALLSTIDIGDSSPEDWTQSYDEEALQVSLEALVQVLALDPQVLACEALYLGQRLIDDPTLGLFNLELPRVDVPEPDWSRITSGREPAAFRQALEKMLSHPADGIVRVAKSLLRALDAKNPQSR